MELAKFSEIIQNDYDDSDIYRPSIDDHEQNRNRNSHPWTYLIDLVRDSFDQAMEKDKKLAYFLLNKWLFYPYSIFYRLILYAVTKYSKKPLSLNEEIAIELFEEKPDQTLWSSSCQNEVLKFLRDRKLSQKPVEKILSLIMKGSSRHDINDSSLKEYKERDIYLRLHHLKFSGVQFPKDIEKFYKKIPVRYSFKPSTREEAEQEGFSFYIGEPTQIGSEKRYHNMTYKETFEEIKHTKPNTLPFLTDKIENFSFFSRDFPNKAFKVLCMFPDNDINSAPYWDVFINEISTITDIEKSNDYFLKSFEKIMNYSDEFLKKCLWSLIHGFNVKGSLIYHKDKKKFKKWWDRLWNLSIKEKSNNDSDISFSALNSHLGKLSQSIFHILRSKFPDRKFKKNGKIPEDIKEYFQTVIQGGKPSALYHFGSCLWSLWILDKEWIRVNIKPLMTWGNKKETICKALWSGYLHHPKWDPDFLYDFKSEFFELILNRKALYKAHKTDIHSEGCCENIATILLIATGGRKLKNIFKDEETTKLIQSLDTDILESISRQIWHLLEDSGSESEKLWSEKIKPWVKDFWPKQDDKMNHKIAENLSFVILHCGNKLPEAFNLLKDQVEGVMEENSHYIAHYIVKDEEDETRNKNQQEKGNNKQDLEHIYNYPNELLQILDWNFPNRIYYDDDKKIEKILDKLKTKHPDIENNEQYQKLFDKITYY